MRKLINRVFARYGIDALLRPTLDDLQIKVLFWSVNSKSWQNMQKRFSVIGQTPRGQYVCLFSAETEVEVGDGVYIQGCSYEICRVETYLDNKGPVCRWALCTVRGGEDNWR